MHQLFNPTKPFTYSRIFSAKEFTKVDIEATYSSMWDFLITIVPQQFHSRITMCIEETEPIAVYEIPRVIVSLSYDPVQRTDNDSSMP